jgi:hypothetical protein
MTNSSLRSLAVATDTKLADLYATAAKLDSAKASAYADIHRMAGDKQRYVGRTRTWGMSNKDAYALLQDRLALSLLAPYEVPAAERAMERLASVDLDIDANRSAIAEQDAIFEKAGGWARFFVVRGGHIHADLSYFRCSRTPTTDHGWNPSLSGATEAEAVAELGPSMCTICFPSAPVEWTVGKPKPARCAGSGTYVRSDRRWAPCGTCGENVTKTPSGYLRAHKPAETAN